MNCLSITYFSLSRDTIQIKVFKVNRNRNNTYFQTQVQWISPSRMCRYLPTRPTPISPPVTNLKDFALPLYPCFFIFAERASLRDVSKTAPNKSAAKHYSNTEQSPRCHTLLQHHSCWTGSLLLPTLRLILLDSANTWKVKDCRLLECYAVLTGIYRRLGEL
jgi:hypothetical protein